MVPHPHLAHFARLGWGFATSARVFSLRPWRPFVANFAVTRFCRFDEQVKRQKPLTAKFAKEREVRKEGMSSTSPTSHYIFADQDNLKASKLVSYG